MSFNLTRTYNKTAEGLYPRLITRGESIIRQGIDAGCDEHDIWRDWVALIKECILNPDFNTRRLFTETYTQIKSETKH